MIEVRPSPGKGRGLFASHAILVGTIISEAPVTFLEDGSYHQLDDYIWTHGDGRSAITWGVQSLVNHDDKPNCYCIFFEETGLDCLLALRDIEPGEELLIDYES